MTTLFHHTFTPLRNGIVASEAAWKKVARLKVPSLPCPANCRDGFVMANHHGIPCKTCGTKGIVPGPCRVLVAGDDLFAESEGPILCPKTGEELSINANGHVWPMGWPSMSDGDDWGCRDYTRADILHRLFILIDACPNLTFVLRTRHTENVMRMMPGCMATGAAHGDPCNGGRVQSPNAQFTQHCPVCRGSGVKPRTNLILMAECHTQADIDRQVPHLLRCRELAGVIGVHAVPSEAINIRRYFMHSYRCDAYVPPPDPVSYAGQGHGCKCPYPQWLTISGGSSPMHPAWVRSLVEQATAAGCPVWFEDAEKIIASEATP